MRVPRNVEASGEGDWSGEVMKEGMCVIRRRMAAKRRGQVSTATGEGGKDRRRIMIHACAVESLTLLPSARDDTRIASTSGRDRWRRFRRLDRGPRLSPLPGRCDAHRP